MNALKNFFRRLSVIALFTLPSAVVLAPGCTIGKTICDLKCECQKCSDRAFDDCVDGENEKVDIADAYGCRAEYDAFIECYESEFSCDDKTNSIESDKIDCGDELTDYNECVADSTGHETGTGSGGPSSGPTTSGGGTCTDFIPFCMSCGFTQAECESFAASLTDEQCAAAIAQGCGG